jgi:hypothetical protein
MKLTEDPGGFFASIQSRFAAMLGPTDPLSQGDIDSCGAIQFKSSADIAAKFSQHGGFIPWFNANLSAKPAFKPRGPIKTDPVVATRFNAFWDQIPGIFGLPAISAIEFSALMSIGIQENSGDLWSNPELIGKPPSYPGLEYAFEAIPNLKSSYNVNNSLGNLTAYTLFNNADYVDAHRGAAGYQAVSGNGINPSWNTATWPSAFRPDVSEGINGYIMAADFYKFRGRGVIQTTGRSDYKIIAQYILNNAAALNRPALTALKAAWNAYKVLAPGSNKLDVIASRSTNADWDAAFGEDAILAAGVSEDSKAKGDYLKLSHDASVLNGGTGTKGSLYFMARKINGGNYPNEVVPMMKTMIRALADVAKKALQV